MKKNLKIRKSFKWLSLVLALSIIHCQLSIAIAQYPVRSQAIIKSPYSAALSDYYTGTDAKLQLILTNTDIREPLIHARLQLSIVSNRVTLRSRAFIGSVIELDAGVPKFLSGMDLAIYFNPSNIEILSGLDYNALFKSPRLPDGTYTFRFDVVDAFTGRLLSDPKSLQSPINILSVDPPFLNLPRKGDNMRYTDPLNIIFNWTPRAANKGVTEYTFSLYEILDNGMPPENAPFMSQPIYQTTTQTTTLLYGPTEPPLLPGKRYAWRIRAVAKQGIDSYSIYNNDGYTETFWFQLQDNCDPVKIITATVKGGGVTLEWADNPAMYKYIVQYRKKGDWNRWFSTETNNNKVIITDVAAGNTYEYQVGGICTVGAGATYSDIRAFTIPPRDSVRDKQCGILPNINLANQKPLENLGIGEGVMVGDFPATILSVSANGNNSFSGTAAIKLNIFNIAEAAVKASFDNVVFNTDKQLIKGFFVTTYDSAEKQIADLDKVFEGGNDVGAVKTGLDSVDVKVNFPINKPEDIKVTINPDGTAVINATGANGQTKQITVQSLPTTIKDSEGNIYNVDKDGKVTKVGKTGEFKGLDFKQFNTIATNKATVTFIAHPEQQYAFDAWKEVYNKSNIFKAAYELLSNSYHVSSKAIEAGKTDFVKAVIDVKDKANIIADSVKFVTGRGTRFESKYIGNNEYEINIIGGPSKDAQELYAIYPNSSSNGGGQVGAYLSFGKLLISSYPHQKQKLVLVPVNGASINKQEISKQLNDIYNKIAVEFDVQQDANFNDNSWDINKDGALQVDGSGLFSTLTDEMKALNNAYRTKRTIDKSTIYLFVLSKASQQGVVGDMPRNKQFGYLFNGSDGRTVAHEVGHGLFHLKHSFDSQYGFAKGELSNNVMDYPNGDQFAKLQWDAIHAPGLVIGLFESDGDAQSVIIYKRLPAKFTNQDKDSTYTFLTPSGGYITLPHYTTGTVFFYGLPNFNSWEIPTGVLVNFTLINNGDTTQYQAKYQNNKFIGYYNGSLFLPASEIRNGIYKNTVIVGIPYQNKFVVHKIKSGTLKPYSSQQQENLQPEKSLPVIPFSTTNNSVTKLEFMGRDFDNLLGEEQQNINPDYIDMLAGHEEKPEMLSVLKIIQLRTLYPQVFKAFTYRFDGWNVVQNSGVFDFGVWDKKVYDNPTLKDQWKSNPVAFYNSFIDEFVNFSQTINQSKFNILDSLDANTSPLKIMLVLNTYSNNEIERRFSASNRLLTISILANNKKVRDEAWEDQIVRLIKYTPANQSDSLLQGILGANKINANKKLLHQLIRNIDDAFIGFGEDNYKALILAFIKVANQSPTFINKVKAINENNFYEHYVYFKYDNILKRFFNYNTPYIQSGASLSDNDVKLATKVCMGLICSSIGDDKTYGAFDPIWLSDATGISMMQDISQANAGAFVPAIVLKYADDKADMKTSGDLINAAIDVASFASGYGAIKSGVTGMRRALTIVDLVGSGVSLTDNITGGVITANAPYAKAVLDAMNLLSAGLAITNLNGYLDLPRTLQKLQKHIVK